MRLQHTDMGPDQSKQPFYSLQLFDPIREAFDRISIDKSSLVEKLGSGGSNTVCSGLVVFTYQDETCMRLCPTEKHSLSAEGRRFRH